MTTGKIKLKEKLARDWWLKNRDLNLQGEGTFSSSEAWIEGFEFGLKLCSDKVDEWEGVGKDSFLFLGEEEVEND